MDENVCFSIVFPSHIVCTLCVLNSKKEREKEIFNLIKYKMPPYACLLSYYVCVHILTKCFSKLMWNLLLPTLQTTLHHHHYVQQCFLTFGFTLFSTFTDYIYIYIRSDTTFDVNLMSFMYTQLLFLYNNMQSKILRREIACKFCY